MYNDLMKTLTEQSEQFFSPAIKFNQLVAKNIEQLAQIQLDATENFTKTSVEQLKTAAEVKDVKSFIDFNASQLTAMNKLSQQMIDDGQKLTQLGNEFKEHLDAISKDSVKATAKA
ncbi:MULTISPECIES: phasin family protein [Pseudoalteromonas]|uniref:Phasin family protein n=1 Tax=Pseudoalteromonas viridis TaxID=339617 RepID=A0ABX7V4U0_9GAMM|nr:MULTISPECIES: phasin family protein [Pseudoalteromonas]QTL35520.1 phasin family protein [Pseudoalteromonas viridis]